MANVAPSVQLKKRVCVRRLERSCVKTRNPTLCSNTERLRQEGEEYGEGKTDDRHRRTPIADIAAGTRRARVGPIGPGDVLHAGFPGSAAAQDRRTDELRHHGGTADAVQCGRHRRRPLRRHRVRRQGGRSCVQDRHLERVAGARAARGGAFPLRRAAAVPRTREQHAAARQGARCRQCLARRLRAAAA